MILPLDCSLASRVRTLADDERAGDSGRNDALLLQSHPDEVGGELLGAQTGGDVDVLAQPFDGGRRGMSVSLSGGAELLGEADVALDDVGACRRFRGAA